MAQQQPGPYLYCDPSHEVPQRAEVQAEGGKLVARFLEADEEAAGFVIPVQVMLGRFEPR